MTIKNLNSNTDDFLLVEPPPPPHESVPQISFFLDSNHPQPPKVSLLTAKYCKDHAGKSKHWTAFYTAQEAPTINYVQKSQGECIQSTLECWPAGKKLVSSWILMSW